MIIHIHSSAVVGGSDASNMALEWLEDVSVLLGGHASNLIKPPPVKAENGPTLPVMKLRVNIL